jgi:hypothetical protein
VAAIVAAIVFYLLATLPARPVRVSLDGADPDLARRTVAGAYHVHTNRSDGAGSKADVAAAAKRAGLHFVITTDHGDGTRPPDPAEYLDSVLVIDAVEISTNGGHYVALGLPQAPYPLAGDAAAVVEDVARLGGFGIVAHPDHPREELAWRDWSLPVDGIEWINADSEWRAEGPLAFARSLAHYLVRPAGTIAGMFDRPDTTLARWDELNRTRRVIALAAVDAHGGGNRSEAHDGEGGIVFGPGYESSFRTLTNRVVLDAPFTGDAAADASRLLAAIRDGRVYAVVDAFSPDVLIAMGERDVAVRSPLPSGAEVVEHREGDAARIEIHLAGAAGDPPVPWVMTNRVNTPQMLGAPELAPWGDEADPMTTGEWRVEHRAGSIGDLEAHEGGFTLRYELEGGERESQYVAAASDLSGEPFTGIYFEATADRPMRVSVQLRYPPDDHRWVRSVYVDATTRTVFVPVERLSPTDAGGGSSAPPDVPRSILFVVDLVNASPGQQGSLTIRDLRASR